MGQPVREAEAAAEERLPREIVRLRRRSRGLGKKLGIDEAIEIRREQDELPQTGCRVPRVA